MIDFPFQSRVVFGFRLFLRWTWLLVLGREYSSTRSFSPFALKWMDD